MATIEEVVDAVAAVFESIDFTAYREPVGTVDAPAAVVAVGPGQPEDTMDGDSGNLPIVVDLFFHAGPEGMKNLYACLNRDGEQSLFRLFNNDQTLGGLVDFAVFTGWEKPDRATLGGENGPWYYHVEVAINVGVS